MKIKYTGNNEKVIPNIGLFKPHEPVEVTPEQAEILLTMTGFVQEKEKKAGKKKTAEKEKEAY